MKQTSEIDTLLDAFNEALATLGVQLDSAARDDALAALTMMNGTSPFRTFVHNDPCPDNMFYDGNTLRLIDFEDARFGHALRDGLYGRIPFPTCWCCNRVANEVADEMERVYRQAFGAACPAVLDDALYEAEVAAVACIWVIDPGMLKDPCMLKDAFERDHEWGIAGIRARVLTRLETCLAATANTERWSALRDTYTQMYSKLIQLWPNATHLPLYPAFRKYTSSATQK
jgi:Phosphotransferase enzyme family